MMTCPKCDFAQPKDQYCANCGINMEGFTPKKEPTLKRFWNNPWTQAFIMIILLSTTINYFLFKNKTLPEEVLLPPPSVEESLPASLDTEKLEPEPFEMSAQENSEIPAPSAPKESHKKVLDQTSAPPPTQLQFQFAEGTNRFLSDLENAPSIGSQIRGITVSEFNSLTEFSRARSSLASLPGSSTETLEVGKTTFITYTGNINDEEFGISFEITPSQVSSEMVSLNIKINASLPARPELELSELSIHLEDELPIKPGDIVILSDILNTQRVLTEQELSKLGSSPLNILASKEFQNGDTDFFILLHTK